MPRRPLPEPTYISEVLLGCVLALPHGDGKGIVVLGEIPPDYADHAVLFEGVITVRFALTYNSPALPPLVPGLFVSERGVGLTGREAWDFLFQNFQLYPRADLIGIDVTGAGGQTFLRALDFGAPVRTFAYDSPEAAVPLTEIVGIVNGAGETLPELIGRYVEGM
ncbi:MAG TPA: hypothetical protein PLD47_04030 [Aggregatilineales bacterium]|nr:hypothetical protein [Anaerolineales bacterium]HRE46870.1 hypothetical protein [Aggregatilineales bacterium]